MWPTSAKRVYNIKNKHNKSAKKEIKLRPQNFFKNILKYMV